MATRAGAGRSPQQVVKFERAIIRQGNVFEEMAEEIGAMLQRGRPL